MFRLGRNGAHSLGRIRPTNTKQYIAMGLGLRPTRLVTWNRNLSSNVLMLVMYQRPQVVTLWSQTYCFFLLSVVGLGVKVYS